MKKIISALILILIIGAWGSLFYRNNTLPQEYSDALAKAEQAYEEGYFLEAQKLLKEAEAIPGITPSYRSAVLQKEIYMGLKQSKNYESQLKKMINQYPETEENYEELVQFYYNNEDYNSLSDCLDAYVQKWSENAVIQEIDKKFSTQYRYRETRYYDVDYVSSDMVSIRKREYELGDGDEQVIEQEIWDAYGDTVFMAEASAITISENKDSFFVCDSTGDWTLVDGKMHLIARNDDVSFEQIGRLSNNGIAVAVVDGKKRYINGKMQVNKNIWEDCSSFSEDVAAVKQNGKWAFVTMDTLGTVEEFPYDKIAVNAQDYCIANGKAVVTDGTGSYILDVTDKKPVSENRYEELKAFNSKQPIAYRSGNLWGFVSSNGEIMTEAMYEDAESYVNGYAAVKQNGLWGFVDRFNQMVIEPQFLEVTNVLDSGYTYVRNEEGLWDQIIIDRLYYAVK